MTQETISTWNPNGVAGINVTQAFGYDAYDRINSASEGSGWTQTYLYDQFGNHAVQSGGYIPNPNGTPTGASQLSSSTNQWTGSGRTYTWPGNGFAQSGLAVPYSATQYLGSGQGIMGPYVPIVSYVSLATLPSLIPTFPTAPPPNMWPNTAPQTNATSIIPPNTVQDFPAQFWPSTPSDNGVQSPALILRCGSTATEPPPQIDFVGTQFSIPVDTSFSGSPQDCYDQTIKCSQIFAQSTEASGGYGGTWQPGLPLTIEGSRFGFLPDLSLPYSTTTWPSTEYLTITDTHQNNTSWTSPNATCQMLILDWTQTSITVIPNIVTGEMNGQMTTLSPLTDTGPVTLANASLCPVIGGNAVNPQDTITFTVTNPQTLQQTSFTSPAVLSFVSGSTPLN